MAEDNFYSTLKGIPIDYLVASPLLAAARGNLALAQNMEEFILQVTYPDGKPGKEINQLSFTLTRPYTDPNTGNVESQTINVNIPLIAIVPIPALLVDKVTINFTTTVNTTTSTNVNVNANIGAQYGFGAFQMSANLSTSVSHMRSSNQSATYQFYVQADQQPATEGMGQMLDILASTIAPIPASGGGS